MCKEVVIQKIEVRWKWISSLGISSLIIKVAENEHKTQQSFHLAVICLAW